MKISDACRIFCWKPPLWMWSSRSLSNINLDWINIYRNIINHPLGQYCSKLHPSSWAQIACDTTALDFEWRLDWKTIKKCKVLFCIWVCSKMKLEMIVIEIIRRSKSFRVSQSLIQLIETIQYRINLTQGQIRKVPPKKYWISLEFLNMMVV